MVEPFFIVLSNKDLWNLIKSFMCEDYSGKKSSTFDNYKDGVAAIVNGYTHLINNKVLEYKNIPWNIGHKIISHGRLELVIAARTKTPIKFSTHDLSAACRLGFVDIVKYLHRNLRICASRSMINESATNGHLEVVTYLINNTNVGCAGDIPDIVISKGYLEILKLLFSRRKAKCTHRGLNSAVKNGNLEMVKFIVLNMQVSYNEYTLTLTDNQEIITFLEDNL